MFLGIASRKRPSSACADGETHTKRSNIPPSRYCVNNYFILTTINIYILIFSKCDQLLFIIMFAIENTTGGVDDNMILQSDSGTRKLLIMIACLAVRYHNSVYIVTIQLVQFTFQLS